MQGHICKKPQLFMMLPSALDGLELEETESCEEAKNGGLSVECKEQEAQITLHTLSSHSTNNTIKLLGMSHRKFLRILVDSGTTNNFLDPWAAKRIKAALRETNAITMTVADGFKVFSHQHCPKLFWSIQGDEF